MVVRRNHCDVVSESDADIAKDHPEWDFPDEDDDYVDLDDEADDEDDMKLPAPDVRRARAVSRRAAGGIGANL